MFYMNVLLFFCYCVDFVLMFFSEFSDEDLYCVFKYPVSTLVYF